MEYAFTLWTLITGLQFQQTESARYFEANVRPIMKAKCSVCHSSMPGMDWTQYEQAKKSAQKISWRIFVLKNMPPAGLPQLTAPEKDIIKIWIQSEAGTQGAK